MLISKKNKQWSNKQMSLWHVNNFGITFEIIKYKTLYFWTNIKQTIKIAKQFTDSNFDAEVLKSDKPVLVDLWAEWCGPCRMLTPIIEELHTEYDGKAIIGKLNVDENPEVSAKYGVRSIPTLLIFKNGELVDKQVGVVPKSALAKKLDAQMA